MSAVIRSLEKKLARVSGENLEVRVSLDSPDFEDVKSFIREDRNHISLIKGLGI